MTQPTERVTMMWPVELKDAVRLAGGGKTRGMTRFTIDAVQRRLSELAAQPVPEPPSPDFIAPPRCDPEACEQGYLCPTSHQRECLAHSNYISCCDDLDCPSVAPSRIAWIDKLATTVTTVSAPIATSTPELIGELRDRYGLTTASEITAPPPLTPEPEPEPAPPAPPSEPEPSSDACPNCHSPLVDGECWTCTP